MHSTNFRTQRLYLIQPATILFIGMLLSVFACQTKKQAVEKYGFVTMLGNDTISVEGVTRQGNEITSNEVDRFPRLRIRHTIVDLNEDGSIKHLVMDINTPSEPPGQQHRKVVADISDKKVVLTKTDSTGTVTREFATDRSPVVAHVPQMYSLYEIYFAAAMKKAAASNSNDPVALRQFYIDREFDRFPLGHATVKLLQGGSAEVSHDWLSGIGEAVMDSAYHMLRYSGDRSTYKVQVERLNDLPDLPPIAARFTSVEKKNGDVRSMSVRDTVRAGIGNAQFFIDYGRPLMRGRVLLGDVIPYDRVWRTGANAATQFTTSVPIQLAGLPLPAGTYTLWTAPHSNSVDLIVNKQYGQWGTEYNRSLNLGTAAMTTESLPSPVEQFTISVVPKDVSHGSLVMEWGSFRWTAPIEVQK